MFPASACVESLLALLACLGTMHYGLGRQKRWFLSKRPILPRINRLARTKTLGKTFAVLAGFCHSEA
jgi:hypothetical protein